MNRIILIFFFLVSFSASILANEPTFDPLDNEMAKDWLAINATSTVTLVNHWYYTASGTVNINFGFGQDDNYFEVKLLFNRILSPFLVRRKRGRKVLYVYGPDYYGLPTRMIRIHCPTTPSSALQLDPWDGVAICEGHTGYFYKVVGSSTFLHIKKDKLRIKEIK